MPRLALLLLLAAPAAAAAAAAPPVGAPDTPRAPIGCRSDAQGGCTGSCSFGKWEGNCMSVNGRCDCLRMMTEANATPAPAPRLRAPDTPRAPIGCRSDDKGGCTGSCSFGKWEGNCMSVNGRCDCLRMLSEANATPAPAPRLRAPDTPRAPIGCRSDGNGSCSGQCAAGQWEGNCMSVDGRCDCLRLLRNAAPPPVAAPDTPRAPIGCRSDDKGGCTGSCSFGKWEGNCMSVNGRCDCLRMMTDAVPAPSLRAPDTPRAPIGCRSDDKGGCTGSCSFGKWEGNCMSVNGRCDCLRMMEKGAPAPAPVRVPDGPHGPIGCVAAADGLCSGRCAADKWEGYCMSVNGRCDCVR